MCYFERLQWKTATIRHYWDQPGHYQPYSTIEFPAFEEQQGTDDSLYMQIVLNHDGFEN
jgi:hypothetical protein